METIGKLETAAKIKIQFKKVLNNKQSRQIIFSFIFRLAAIACNILNIRLLLQQLESYQYGLLITIISITTWFTFVDFGLANGLRNKISQSLSISDFDAIKKYVTAGYIILFKVIALLIGLIVILNFVIDWSVLLKVPAGMKSEVNFVFFYGMIFFLLKIFLELINPVLFSFHKAGEASFIAFVSQAMILVVCYVLRLYQSHSFVQYGLVFFWVPIVVLSIFSAIYFSTIFKKIRPSSMYVGRSYKKGLLSLGGNFFIIQIALLLIFTTDNVIIGRILGYNYVSDYNVAFRLFNLPVLFYSIVLVPYWPLFAELFSRNEQNVIKSKMKRLIEIWALCVLGSILLLLVAPYIYDLWVGETVHVSFILSIGMLLFCIISTWNSLFVTLINSTSKLRVQLYTVFGSAIINIPLSIVLAKYTNLGSAGVIFASCISMAIGSIVYPIQCRKFILRTATGIWNK